MLDPDQTFVTKYTTRRAIADEINCYLDGDHQIEPTDDRLTDQVCLEWADAIDSWEGLVEGEDAEAEALMRLAINTAAEIGLGDYIENEWKGFIEVWYEITGVDRSGKRFKKMTSNETYARGHNVWRGTLWKCTNAGRKRIHTWDN